MLSDKMVPALEEYIAECGGGMVTGFLCVVDYIDAEGDPSLIVATMDGQRTILSLGMVEYAREWFADDARYQIANCVRDEDD